MMKQKLIYDYFYSKAFKLNSPVSVMIELLTKCNMHCEHCYLPTHTDEGLDFKTICNLLCELKELGVLNVSLTGGEIFLREDLLDIVKFARSLYMRVFLLSNGTMLNNRIIEQLSQMHIAEFSTTIFSMQDKIHDSITGKKGSLDTVKKNLAMLKEAQVKIRVKTPVMKKNAHDFMNIKVYCAANGFEYRASPLIFSKTNGDKTPQNFRLQENELAQIMQQIDSISRSEHLHINEVPCAALFYSFAIDCKGDVYPCNSFFYKVGNIYQNTLKYIWYESEEMKLVRSIRNTDLKSCTDCDYKLYCDRCPGMVYMENKDLYSCDKFAQALARIRMSGYSTACDMCIK